MIGGLTIIQLAIIGGFLGSGKTTFINLVSNFLTKKGYKVGIIVNDQGHQNIDKLLLQKETENIKEVSNGCFCCNLTEFIKSVNSFKDNVDIILAEPSGSCTDLIATVFLPLKQIDTKIVFLPFTVITDPKKILRILENDDETRYLFEQQVREADLVLINKIDLYNREIIEKAKEKIINISNNTDILEISSLDQQYALKWSNNILNITSKFKKLDDIDYKIYGDAEANLAWFDVSINVNCTEEIDTDKLLYDISCNIIDELNKLGAKIEHVKMYIYSNIGTAKLSITGNTRDDIFFDKKLPFETKDFNLLISCRVKVKYLLLKDSIMKVIGESLKAYNMNVISSNAFSPKPPNPFIRISQ